MRKSIGLLVLSVCAGWAVSVNAATLTFEEVGELAGSGVYRFAEVGVFSFTDYYKPGLPTSGASQGGVGIWDAVNGGKPYLASSPDNAVYMDYAFIVSMTLTDGGTFDLNGANFGNTHGSGAYQFDGYMGGEQVYSELFFSPPVGDGGTLHYKSFDWENVDRVEFSKAYNTNGWTTMDDLQYSVSPVPLPAAAWLFISAIAGLAGAKRLSRSKGSA